MADASLVPCQESLRRRLMPGVLRKVYFALRTSAFGIVSAELSTGRGRRSALDLPLRHRSRPAAPRSDPARQRGSEEENRRHTTRPEPGAVRQIRTVRMREFAHELHSFSTASWQLDYEEVAKIGQDATIGKILPSTCQKVVVSKSAISPLSRYRAVKTYFVIYAHLRCVQEELGDASVTSGSSALCRKRWRHLVVEGQRTRGKRPNHIPAPNPFSFPTSSPRIQRCYTHMVRGLPAKTLRVFPCCLNGRPPSYLRITSAIQQRRML